MCEARRHDTASAYNNDRCRCPRGRDERTRQQKRAHRARARGRRVFVPVTGTRRRLQALSAIGWDMARLVEMTGLATLRSKGMYDQTRPRIAAETARRVAEVYNRLSMTPGPSVYARNAAREHGWPPPLQWPDELIDNPAAKPVRLRLLPRDAAPDPVAVERALAGEQLPLWPADRLEVARRIVARGGGPSEVSRVLRCNGTRARRLVEQVAS